MKTAEVVAFLEAQAAEAQGRGDVALAVKYRVSAAKLVSLKERLKKAQRAFEIASRIAPEISAAGMDFGSI